MHILVQVKVGFLVECFATYVTFERFFTTMNAHMSFEIAIFGKILATKLALEGFYALVGAEMDF